MPEMLNVMEFQWFVTEIMCYMSFPKVPAEIHVLIFFIISLFCGGLEKYWNLYEFDQITKIKAILFLRLVSMSWQPCNADFII